MKKIISRFFLVIAGLSAVVLILVSLVILVTFLGAIFGLPKLTTPKYIFNYTWWYLLGSALLTAGSVMLVVVLSDTKKVRQ